MNGQGKAATPVLNGAGRTSDEERLVRWTYYLGIVIGALDRRRPPIFDMLVEHGYSDPTVVVREIEAALHVERWAKYPYPPTPGNTDSPVSP